MNAEAIKVVLISVGLVAGVSVALGALIVAAERYLLNYGTCKLDVNGGKKVLEVAGGKSLLSTLMEEGIFIPSACGGRGSCGYCKLKVKAGGGPVLPTETPYLSKQEIADGVRLSCQVKVRNDIAVEIPEHLFAVSSFRGRVSRIADMTHDIKLLRIELIEPETITFRPGQYVQLQTPAYGDVKEPVYRAYSVASPPHDNRAIELIIRLAPGGICTTWVFTILKEGDEVQFNGPYGEFVLSDSDAEMFWIAGGSGMAPFWGLVRHMKETGIRRKTTYFFGAVSKRDLFLLDELKSLEKEMENFTFVPCLSSPQQSDEWKGEVGLVTQIFDRKVEANSSAEAYLCGSAGMIDASVKAIQTKGIPKEKIFYDKFN
ncbi:MAG TPA: 2Fe-2S iron-sulfur cluster binding domain-containing protein [Candidatus Brocadiia bacterium]|nr:2Fe-2S iron-sulfur cluster binding domain-containing protein [Candidatus Brocadiia bacterium]